MQSKRRSLTTVAVIPSIVITAAALVVAASTRAPRPEPVWVVHCSGDGERDHLRLQRYLMASSLCRSAFGAICVDYDDGNIVWSAAA